ncbi:SCO family protein [Pseudomarimonas arenosa]|uniref:SCO family protein n=1 Tax=Pseudomarimonas arenosa TaxID=2774145 RepID=A0AAW3ZT22_9GAMM|nr:SCO family protein [Pseudomarimonas arenosa]MBD8527980.1 SCO family protein [Pseudomarimonas arenosa]
MNSPTPSPGHGRLPIVAVLLVAVLAGLGLVIWQRTVDTSSVRPSTSAMALHTTLLYPEPRPVPDFQLDRADGSPLTQADLNGKWTLLFIGFTHCPDVCPTTLSTLAAALKQLDAEASTSVQILFVSVDPERDSPQRAGEYAAFFDPRIIAASADHARLEPFTRSLGLVYAKADDSENYGVDHSASISIISPDGRRFGLIRPPHEARKVAEDVRAVVATYGAGR